MQLDTATTTTIIGDGLVGVLLTVTGWLAVQKLKAQDEKNKEYDRHLKECNTKAINHAQLEGKVNAIDGRVCRIETTMDRMDGKLDRLLER